MGNLVVKSTRYHIHVNTENRQALVFEQGQKGIVGETGIRGFPNTDASGYVSTEQLAAYTSYFDSHLDALDADFSDTWHIATYLNSWGTLSSWPAARYIMYKQQVFLEGLPSKPSAASTETIFKLPTNYRPHNNLLVAVLTNNGVGQLYIQTSGDVKFVTGDPTWVGLFGISFGIE